MIEPLQSLNFFNKTTEVKHIHDFKEIEAIKNSFDLGNVIYLTKRETCKKQHEFTGELKENKKVEYLIKKDFFRTRGIN